MNPLHWDREQWKDAAQGFVLMAVLWTELFFSMWILQ